jgi:hypothetical protein
MKKTILWVLAILITLAVAGLQRATGPSYPVLGKMSFAGQTIHYRLDRSADNSRDHEVRIAVPDSDIGGFIQWKTYPSDELWMGCAMKRQGGALVGILPRLPKAVKLEYRITISRGNDYAFLTGEKSVILRYHGHVPLWLLIAHILVMFLAMLFSTRAGLAAWNGREGTRFLVYATLGLLFVGGFVLGPIVQKYSFGVFWAGLPGGIDFTDNKTLVAFLIWIGAAIAGRNDRKARAWVLAASIVTLVVYLIPHSLLGSQFRQPTPPKK